MRSSPFVPRLLAVVVALSLVVAGPVQAQAARPSGLQPLPEVPPPAGVDLDASLAPEVTISKRGEDKVEEFRVNGKLYMLRITPPHGRSYYLIDEQGSGSWVRRDGPDTGLRVPMWVIHSF